jgi:hypothetical protein
VILAASSGKRASLSSVAAAAASSTSTCGGGNSTNKPASPACSTPLINNLSGKYPRHFSIGQQQLHRRNNNINFRSNAGNSSSSAYTPSSSRAFSSSSKRDFYDVLGVGRGADKGEIKKAYFKLAKKYNPDTNKDDKAASEKFKEATEA